MSARPPISLQSTVLESLIFPLGPFYPEEGAAVGGGSALGEAAPGVRAPATLKESGVCGKMGLVFCVCVCFLGGRGHSLVVFVAENGV